MAQNDSKWQFWDLVIQPNSTEIKIKSFRDLLPGWRFGDGLPPTLPNILKAIRLNKIARGMGFSNTDSQPMVDGGIELIISHNQYQLEFHIEPDGTVTYYKMRNNEDIQEEENLSFDDAVRKINEFWDEECAPSDYSRSMNSIRENQDSVVPDLATQVMDREYPLSMGTASTTLLGTPVAT